MDIETHAKLHGVPITGDMKNQLERYDGHRLDEIVLFSTLTCKKDFDDLITFLRIHKHCFHD